MLSVTHLIADQQISEFTLRRLSILASSPARSTPRVRVFGPAAPLRKALLPGCAVARHGPLWRPCAALRELADHQPQLLHVWNEHLLGLALRCCAAGRERGRAACAVLFEVGDQAQLRHAVRWYRARTPGVRLAVACHTARRLHQALSAGIAPHDAALTPTGVDVAALARSNRATLRESLGLAHAQRGVLLVPPLNRAAALRGVWGVLLARHVNSSIQLLIATDAHRDRDAMALVRAARMGPATTASRRTLAELLIAADVALALPVAGEPLCGVAWSMGAGTPLVAAAQPEIADWVQHGDTGLLVRPADPRDVARRVLQAVEQEERSAAMAQAAQRTALRAFRRSDMVETYAQVYEQLAGGAPLAGATAPTRALG